MQICLRRWHAKEEHIPYRVLSTSPGSPKRYSSSMKYLREGKSSLSVDWKNMIFPKPIKKKRKWNYFTSGKSGNKNWLICRKILSVTSNQILFDFHEGTTNISFCDLLGWLSCILKQRRHRFGMWCWAYLSLLMIKMSSSGNKEIAK